MLEQEKGREIVYNSCARDYLYIFFTSLIASQTNPSLLLILFAKIIQIEENKICT